MEKLTLEDDLKEDSELEAGFVSYANDESVDDLSLYAIESEILCLYDQLIELKLERAILDMQLEFPAVDDSAPDEDDATRIKNAERACLEARARYILKNSIVENVLITDPVLKAIHSGGHATPAERLLHPLLDRRDILGMANTNLSTRLKSSQKALTRIEADNVAALAKNRGLAATLVGLTEQVQARRSSAIADSNLAPQAEKSKVKHEVAKKRWRTMKSVVAAMIAGSGVDWARDSELKMLVLDEEE